ncbi:MAG: S8 family serine peptidase [Cyclobacteriaceae bacterium]
MSGNLPFFKINELSKIKKEALSDDIPSWGFDRMKIRNIWNKGVKGEGIKIGIFDTGFDSGSEISGTRIHTKDCTGGNSINDDHSKKHGTHIAHIIGAEENGIGSFGICPASELYIAKVIDTENKLKNEYLISALEWAIQEELDIINMSIQFKWCSLEVHKLIIKAIENNIIILCAAGNSSGSLYESRVFYPGAYQETIAIGAMTQRGMIASFSSKGQLVDFVAPGVGIETLVATLNGTSVACPFITGIVALYICYKGKKILSEALFNQYAIKKVLIENSSVSDLISPRLGGYGEITTKNMFNL